MIWEVGGEILRSPASIETSDCKCKKWGRDIFTCLEVYEATTATAAEILQ